MSRFWKISALVLSLQPCACASHHPKEDANLAASPTAPVISNEPMDFAARGSDSGKYPGLKTIHFDFDSASVPSAEKDLVSQNAAWIKAHPESKIQIEGHCDARGSVEYNLALGERRAKAVYKAMVAAGVSKDRLSVISYGEERPLVAGDSEEAYAKNRRANFVPLSAAVHTLSSADNH